MFISSKRYCAILILTFLLLIICTGCSNKVTMPYGSSEYSNGDWSIDELVSHFEELGFKDINVEEFESRYVNDTQISVQVEDTSDDAWFTGYASFEKSDSLSVQDEIKIIITSPVPTLTLENSPNLPDILSKRFGSSEEFEEWKSFMKEHDGEYIEFNGSVTDVYDEMWFASGVTVTVCFENYNDITFSWDFDSTNELGFNNDYSQGCIAQGTPSYVLSRIVYSDVEPCKYELITLELINN